ncbi:MAG TPA: GTP cyclohydrolase I FolE [Leptolinea sp.]
MTVSEYLTKSLESDIEPLIQIQTGTLSPGSIVDLIHELLFQLGEDPEREGLEKTPERVSRMYSEILVGYQTNLDELVNGAIFGTGNQDMVVVRDIQFFSMCEHHLLPFFGRAHVAYIPNGKIIGLSKIPRLVEMYARRLQVQERLTHQIAENLESILHPLGIAILMEGFHLCAMMRGVRQSEANLATSCMFGVFEQNGALRNDFFNQIHLRPTNSMSWQK